MEYLGSYAARGAAYERVVKVALAALAAVAVLAAVYYVFFRNWREEQQARSFFELLRDARYEDAYVVWGCTPERPCRYYPYGEFLEDWGPEAPYGPLEDYALGRSYTQAGGVILRYTVNGEEGDPLWVQRDPPALGFAPR